LQLSYLIAVIVGVSADLQRSTLPTCPDCGQICSVEFETKEKGHLYPLLRKKVNCDNIMRRMAFCPFQVIRPPPRKPPPDLLKDFTMDGSCVFGKPWYLDNSASSAPLRYPASSFNSLLDRDRRGISINYYHDRNRFRLALSKYLHAIAGKHVAVVGTEMPWAEATALNLGARQVTTLEYRELYIEDPRVSVFTPYQYAAKFLNRTSDTFDAVLSYSSIEHAGLGRYGDPLMPYGDMEAVAQIWCATKPGGYLFLALPLNRANRTQCVLQWNALRWYSYFRMQHLTANFKVFEEISKLDGCNILYVLQKLQ